MEEEKWIKWSRELLSISKTGITYAKTYYDEERFKRIYEIAEEIVNTNFKTMPEMRIITQDIQKGYATPQVTTRGIIKRKNEILLVHEKGKQWNIPGGYADINDTPTQAVCREILEETGYKVRVKGVVAIYSVLHNMIFPQYAMYFLCELNESEDFFPINNETDAIQFVSIDKIEFYDINQHFRFHWSKLKQLINEEEALCIEVD